MTRTYKQPLNRQHGVLPVFFIFLFYFVSLSAHSEEVTTAESFPEINDQVMLRGVASTAFRAPTVDELFGGESPSFEQITHDASSHSQAEVTVGGNALLTPEEADIMTLGVVLEPDFIPGLSLTA